MTTKTTQQKIGSIGEDIAVRFLVKHGYTIAGRNYLKKFGEIDIICRKGGKIHFVEVKTVSRETPVVSSNSGTTGQAVSRETVDEYRAEDNISTIKLKRIGRTIEAHLFEKDITEDWQFHAVLVILNKTEKVAKIRFLRNLVI